MIIDMRCRITTTEAANYFSTRMSESVRLPEVPALASGTLDAFFEELEHADVTTAVSVSGNNPGARIGSEVLPDRTTSNDFLANVQAMYPGRFIGVAGIDVGNIFHDAVKELERCVNVLGLKAVFIEPGRSPGCLLNDTRLHPIYQKCVDLGVPIIPQTSGPLGGRSIEYANPMYVEDVANDFPDLNIICGHGCYPYVREMIVVSGRCHNVWASPDCYLFGLGTEDWVKAVNENHFGFAEKFIFGSAYPLKPIRSYVDSFFKLPWNEEVLPNILYKNAIKALKLEQDPDIARIYKLTGGA